MEPKVNTVVISTKKLFQIDKTRKEEGKEWDDINWDSDMEGEYQEDCDTHIKIVNRNSPAWKEMFEMQKRTDGQKFCDVNLLGTNGYVPCHRAVLMKKSDFLTTLITSNMRTCLPFSGHKDLNNIISIYIEVDVDILKHVVTLFYTGVCVVTNSNEEEEVKDVLRVLQVDVKCFTILDAATSSAIIRKKKPRPATVCRFADSEQLETQSESATKIQAPPSYSAMAGGSNEIRPSSSSQNQMPGPSPATASSSHGFTDPLPEMRKIPPGTFAKKPAERIQRNNDGKPSTSTPVPTRPPPQGDSDSDEPDALKAPLPEVQKVAPGTLLPLHKQPRIIRNITRGGRRRRGARCARGGRGRGRVTRSTTPGEGDEAEEEDSNCPKGSYERDNDYIPSAREKLIEDDDEVAELGSESEEEAMELSDNETRRPRTRTTASKLDEEHGRYPKRRRREEGSYAKIASGKSNQDHSSPTKTNEIENSPIESLMDAQRPIRTRGAAISPGSNLRSLTSQADDQNICIEGCNKVFQELEELKSHLDTRCGKHWVGQYDLFKHYCDTCKSFFKKYTVKEFLEHVKMCVLSASVRGVRSRSISTKSTDSNKVASTSTSPVRPAAARLSQEDAESETPPPDVKNIAKQQERRCDIIGLKPAKPMLDNLSEQQVKRLQQKLRQKEKLAVSYFPGYIYVFPPKSVDEDKKDAENKNSDAPESTQHAPTEGQTAVPRVEQTSAPRVERTPAHHVEQTPPTTSVTSKTNETLPSVSASSFVPDFTSTPLSPKAKENSAVHKARRTGGRPGPLRSKSKAVEGETENIRQLIPDPLAAKDGPKNVTATQSELEYNSQEGTICISRSNEPTTSKEVGSAGLNTIASRLKASLKKKLNNPQSVVTAVNEANNQVEGLRDVNSTSEAAQSVAEDRPDMASQKSSTESNIRSTNASAIYNKTIEQLVTHTENPSTMSSGGTSNVLNQQRYSPISSASSRTSTPESRMTPISSQQQQHPQLASTVATATGPLQYSNIHSGSRVGVAIPSTSTPAPPPVSSSHVATFESATQNLLTVLQSTKPAQSATPVNAVPVMQQVQPVRFPGQQPIAIRSRHHNTAARSQFHPPRAQSVPPATQLGLSGTRHLTSQTTIHPVLNSSVVAMSLFPQTKSHTITRTQNTNNQQVLPGTTNASLEFEGGLEVRRVNAPQPVAQPAVRTVSPVNGHTQQPYQQQQQQQRYTPPTIMSNMQQQHLQHQHPLPPTNAAIMQQTFNTDTSQARQSPILSNPQPRLPTASTMQQQGYQNMIPQSQQPMNHGTLPQNSLTQHAQYIRPVSNPIQNQAPSTAVVATPQTFVPPSSIPTARHISQNRPVSFTTGLPQIQQYQQGSSTPAVSYQQHQTSQQGIPVSRSVHVTRDGMPYSRTVAAPPSSTPNVSIMQSGAGGYMSSQASSNGNGSSATVRLPVFMNPLVNNRAGQGMMQQQTQQLQFQTGSPQINSIQSLAPAATLSSNITSGGQSSSESGAFTCDDCGDTFGSKESYTDHKNDGFC